MKKIFLDKNIELEEELLKENDIDIVKIDLKDNFDLEKIEYLLLHSPLKDEKLNLMKNCKYIGIRACNTDYVNKTLTEKNRILVEGLKNQYGINAVAEHTMAMIFALSKNLINSNKNIKNGLWRNNLNLNFELKGKTIGIIGSGKIGKKVAKLSKAFGLKVLITDKTEKSLNEILEKSDIITLHISSKKENNNFFDKFKINKMKNNSILINTSRGSVLDYKALEEALKAGKFFGVGLDVFPEEPFIKSNLFKYSKLICSPHIAYLTKESLEKMNSELIKTFLKYLKKENE